MPLLVTTRQARSCIHIPLVYTARIKCAWKTFTPSRRDTAVGQRAMLYTVGVGGAMVGLKRFSDERGLPNHGIEELHTQYICNHCIEELHAQHICNHCTKKLHTDTQYIRNHCIEELPNDSLLQSQLLCRTIWFVVRKIIHM